MKEFVFMQGNLKRVPGKEELYYHTIGLRSLYSGKGYNGCDENGIMSDAFPNNPNKPVILYFPFADEESERQFKGKIIQKEGIYFAEVVYDPKNVTRS